MGKTRRRRATLPQRQRAQAWYIRRQFRRPVLHQDLLVNDEHFLHPGFKLRIAFFDQASAREHARRAKDLATCDGPPDYTYKAAYDEAVDLLKQLP